MSRALATLGRFLRSDDGQDLTEYGLLAALIALVAVGAVTATGGAMQGFWQSIAQSVQLVAQNV
jgi:pilus assembly protein Flp/PilA